MRDGYPLRALKLVARAYFYANRVPLRLWLRTRGAERFTLAGECRRCARCCEAPSVRANAVVWHLPRLRRLFLAWQERVNGFELVESRRRQRLLVFRCTHFDPSTRQCDSYESRPAMCRDYPRALLAQPAPEMLAGCGYRAVAKDAGRLLRVLETQPMTPEQRDRLAKGLYLE